MTLVVMFVDGWSVVGARDMAQVIVVVGGWARSWTSACGRRRRRRRQLSRWDREETEKGLGKLD